MPRLAVSDESYQCVVGRSHVLQASAAVSDNSLVCDIPLGTMSFVLDNGMDLSCSNQ